MSKLVAGTPEGGGAIAAASGEAGAAPASPAVGEAANGDAGGDGTLGTDCTPGAFGTVGTRGKEYISSSAGNAGTVVDAPFSPSRKWGDEPGTASEAGIAPISVPPGGAVGGEDGITVPGAPGTSAIAPASDAGIARKSASVNCPLGGDEGGVGKLGGDAPPGTPGNANISFTGGNNGGDVVGEALPASGSPGSGLDAAGETTPESI